MVEYYSDCVDCADGCHGCGLKGDSPHLVCDKCHHEVDILYEYGEYELCEECLLDSFKVITIEDFESDYDDCDYYED